MRIVLFEPQIPQNAGNIVRTCAVTGCALTLVRPLGFSTASRHLRRAGLDYWEGVDVTFSESLEEAIEGYTPYFFTSHGTVSYHAVEYSRNSVLVFGSETAGLPAWVHDKHSERCVRIPMLADSRCLNLATSAGIAIYEACRQQQFAFQ